MGSHTRLSDDNLSDYDPTDSDEDYTENEKILLEKTRNKKRIDSDSEEELYGVGSDGSSDDNQSDIALSDVEGQDDDRDELPDSRAWGKDKRRFYSTDYVDPDYGGFQGKDAHLAELEEQEARNLQQQLAEQLDDDDFSLDVFVDKSKKAEENAMVEEVVKSDISKLSKRQKLQLLEKESPEFFCLVEDFTEKLTLAKDFLKPTLAKYKKGQIPNSPAIEFVQTQHELILNYCTNIYMYLLLKASRVSLQSHPIVKRLFQYRQLLSQLSPVYDTIKPQIEALLSEADEPTPKVQKKTLSLLKKINPEKSLKKQKASEEVPEQKLSKKVKFNEEVEVEPVESLLLDQEEVQTENDMNPEDGPGKRAITYQIAKNKGLTPHRKKEQRNPRVKHRNKFRKAKIRRKGAVREPRTEMARYGGEMSGIKAGVSKSIKIKT